MKPRGQRSAKLPVVLEPEEQARLLKQPNRKCPTGYRNYCLLLLFLSTGLRRAEALALKPEHINWTSGKLNVIRGKGGKDRVVYLGSDLLDCLKILLEKRPVGAEYLFCTLDGLPVAPKYVYTMVVRYARKAGIKKAVHPHTLRHTFATDLYREDHDIRLVQKALGHADLTSTMIYTHVSDSELEAAMKKLRRKNDEKTDDSTE